MKKPRPDRMPPKAGHSQDDVKLSSQEQADMIVALLADFCEPEMIDQLGDYVQHVGFDLAALGRPQDLTAAWLGHYRIRQGVYDVERAFNDLASYPPIASEIVRQQILQRKV